MITPLIIDIRMRAIEWVVKKYLKYSNCSELPSFYFYVSKSTAPEVFGKIFTPATVLEEWILETYCRSVSSTPSPLSPSF